MEKLINVNELGLTHFQKQALYLYAQQIGARTIKDTNREWWRLSEIEFIIGAYFKEGKNQYRKSARYAAISVIRDFIYGQETETIPNNSEANVIAERILSDLREIEKQVGKLVARYNEIKIGDKQ